MKPSPGYSEILQSHHYQGCESQTAAIGFAVPSVPGNKIVCPVGQIEPFSAGVDGVAQPEGHDVIEKLCLKKLPQSGKVSREGQLMV